MESLEQRLDKEYLIELRFDGNRVTNVHGIDPGSYHDEHWKQAIELCTEIERVDDKIETTLREGYFKKEFPTITERKIGLLIFEKRDLEKKLFGKAYSEFNPVGENRQELHPSLEFFERTLKWRLFDYYSYLDYLWNREQKLIEMIKPQEGTSNYHVHLETVNKIYETRKEERRQKILNEAHQYIKEKMS